MHTLEYGGQTGRDEGRRKRPLCKHRHRHRHRDLYQHLWRTPPPSHHCSAVREEPLELTELILSASLHPWSCCWTSAHHHSVPLPPPPGSNCLQTRYAHHNPGSLPSLPTQYFHFHPLPSLLHLPFLHYPPPPPKSRRAD